MRNLLACVVFALALLPASLARADDKDRWYIVEMFGGKAGWMHTSESRTAETITTSSDMTFSLARGAAGVSISMKSSFVETRDGKPVSMDSTQKLGATDIVQHYTFGPDSIKLESTQQGKTSTSTLPLPDGPWLTPAAAEKFLLQRLRSGATEVTVRTIDPSNGPKVVTVTRTGFTRETITVNDKAYDAIKTTVEQSVMPGAKSTEYVDNDGELIKSNTAIGGVSVVMTIATKELALADGKAPNPEVMTSTFIHPNTPIKDPRHTRKITYTLSVAEGDLPEIPDTGSQTFAKDSRRLTVDAAHFTPAPESDATNPDYLRATSMCNANDEEIKRLAALATKDLQGDKAQHAEHLRRFVYRHITNKNLNVGFASASETAKTRAGDCSEHGVLLAALLRADGIPARVASGLIYAEGFAGSKDIFGYHMWAQALLTIDGKPRWVDLDATLPAATPYDATHIALGTSALAEGDLTSGMTSVAATMGRLAIKVESVE